jgi:ATP-dependent DNA helicase RecG
VVWKFDSPVRRCLWRSARLECATGSTRWFQIELFQLPAPMFEAPGEFTRTVLFSHKPLSEMDKADRVRACYLHACLKWAMRNYLTNSSLWERFGVEERNKATISRYIKEAVEMGLIKPYYDDAAPTLSKYVPNSFIMHQTG